MSPKIVDKDKRKKEIALIALDIFAVTGFESTSISQIAKAANIGKGTVYEYFKSKEELILHSFKYWIEDMVATASELIINEKNSLKKIKTLILAEIKAFMVDPKKVQLTLHMFQMLINTRAITEFTKIVDDLFEMMKDGVAGLFYEGIDNGTFKSEIKDNVETITINLMAFLDGICVYSLIYGDKLDLIKQVNLYLDNLLESIVKK